MKINALSGDYLEIELGEWNDSAVGRVTDEDVLLNVSFRRLGFSGAAQVWIMRPEWQHFVAQLSELERTRRGSACVAGISPGELELTFAATDKAGHMAVRGLIDSAPAPFRPRSHRWSSTRRSCRRWSLNYGVLTEGDRLAADGAGVDFGHAAYGFGEVQSAAATFASFGEAVEWLGMRRTR